MFPRWFFPFLKRALPAALGLALIAGCASPPASSVQRPVPFRFAADTFSYPNELVWEYRMDPTRKTVRTERRNPPPTYSHHCFVVARAARQFFDHAQFAPHLPKTHPEDYRKRIREIVRRNPRRPAASSERILIPGYAHLREFSADHESLLKREAGGAWQSYFQRGHWRMIWPMGGKHQKRMAEQLTRSLAQNRPPVVHVFRFPDLSINHAMVLFDAKPAEAGIEFAAYDPNSPGKPVPLTYDSQAKSFSLPPLPYFLGGFVKVYEVYHRFHY